MVMEGRAAMAAEEGALTTSTPAKETDVVEELLGMIRSVARFGDFRKTQKTECVSLLRRMKLLFPLLEEIRDRNVPIPATALPVLSSLKKAFAMAIKLLKTCNEGSKIYLALETELITSRFHTIYDRLGQALASIPCDELGVSDEVGEQIDLMCMQLKRAKRRTDTQDIELAMDMMVVFSKKDGRNADSAIIERLATKLDLHTFEDLDMETKAVRNLIHERGTTNVESIEHIKNLLNKFRKVAGMVEVKDLDNPVILKKLKKCPSLIIPHEFLCPITLEIMTDPVIVATGQTYERESIQKWLDNDHRTCPTSRDTLVHLSLAPNYALKNLISQWCESNNYKLPKKQTPPAGPACSNENTEEISSLVGKLWSSQLEVQREAVKKIRLLSKECPENRIQIAKTGGIPPLVHLLSYPDSKIQEHAVTALLNLSIDETNKKLITIEGAIPAIIEVLQYGNTEARENSAAALFSLSMIDGNKETVGLSNGIPALVTLLQDGTIRGKKDALTALFNLSLNHSNKGRAIEAGIAQPLLQLVRDKNLHMVDEALSVVLLLASHPDGRQEIGQIPFIGTLVEYIRDGTPKNKECAISVLLELGINNSSYILAALQFGVYEHLAEVSQSGTNRAQRKANALIQLMAQSEQIPSDRSV